MSKKEDLKQQILQLTRHLISGSLPVLGHISSKPVWQNGWV